MAIDPLQDTLDILSANWNDSNTDSLTPNFKKITDQKRASFDMGSTKDEIFAHRSNQDVSPAGTGPANKHESDNFNLDIRTNGLDQEDHWRNVIEEVKRILQLKKVLPNANYTILEFDGVGIDLSDKMRKIWRILLPVQIKRFNISR